MNEMENSRRAAIVMMNQKMRTSLVLLLLTMVAAHASRDYEEQSGGDGADPGLDLGPLLDCTASDISLGLVTSCICRDAGNSCPKCHLQDAGLIDCYAPCSFDNRECGSCDIFYGGVCNCLKTMSGLLPGTPCVGNTAWAGPGKGLPPVWILGSGLNLGSHLISSTILNTGIDQLADIPHNNDGWTLGFQHIDTKTQALAINSRARRSRDEIHIHLCSKKTGPGSPQDFLANQDPTQFATFKPLHIQPLITWYCKATKPTITPVKPNTDSWSTRPSTDYLAWLSTNPPVDSNNLGFALLTDTKNNYLWQCVTTLVTEVTEFVFCT
ncbi:hypothetical protein INT43_005816 [Umbelopsis isabellina]|uniref:Uncharacterized protein n=1 Tax=Mortierella isabellina TaxID=91625 RepID=A0A8H7UCE5_MORIS|nr:hypothetical protein INT43_005816 [Umbelopsis isabellina]